MKQNKKLVALLSVLCASLTGCGTIPSYEDIGSGYVQATYMSTSWEPTAMRTELRYKKGWRTVTIWPSLYAVRDVVKDDVVVFVANIAYEPPYPDEPRATMPRLFAVRAPELPMNITDEVLWRWSKESGEDFAFFNKKACIVHPTERGDGVEFLFATGTHKDIIIRMNWNQVADIMREVKEKGVARKDRVWGASYIEKEFKPETQK